jgi:hypothetical protein
MRLLHVLMALLALVIGLVMLDISEVQARHDLAVIGYVSDHVTEADPATLDPAQDGRIVHVTGLLTADGPVVDPDTGISLPSLSLHRDVQMYQWAHQVSFYTSNRQHIWSTVHVPGGPSVVDPKAPENPPMPYQTHTFYAPSPHLGAYPFDDALVAAALHFLPTPMSGGTPPGSNFWYEGADPADPAVGDVRAWYTDSPYQTVSVIALQSNGKLVPIHFTGLDEDLVLVRHGKANASSHISAIVHGILARRWQGRVQAFMITTLSMVFMLLAFDSDSTPLRLAIGAPICALATEMAVLQLYTLAGEPGFEVVFLWGCLGSALSALAWHRVARLHRPLIARWI